MYVSEHVNQQFKANISLTTAPVGLKSAWFILFISQLLSHCCRDLSLFNSSGQHLSFNYEHGTMVMAYC